ncbi:YqjD family protein [Pseudomonas monteilii]
MPRKSTVQADVEQIKDQVFSELQSLITESEKLLNDSASIVGDDADSLRTQVSEKLRQAREALGEMGNKAKPVVEATQAYIGGHPWQTVAISAGLGVVVGLLLSRRD